MLKFTSARRQKTEDEEKLTPKEELPSLVQSVPLTVVKRSIHNVVATYLDLKVYRYVELDDGRRFEFESIAVERSPGVYAGDDITATYIIVDSYFLYREVTDETDK